MATHSSVLAWRIPGTEGAWWEAVYGFAQSPTRLSDFTFTFSFRLSHKASVYVLASAGGSPWGRIHFQTHWLFAEFSFFWAVWLRAEFPSWLLASFPKFFAMSLKIATCQANKREGLLVRWKTESFNLITEVESSQRWGIPFVRSKLLQEKASYLKPLIQGNNNQWDQLTSHLPQQFRSVCIHLWRWYARNSFQSTKTEYKWGSKGCKENWGHYQNKGADAAWWLQLSVTGPQGWLWVVSVQICRSVVSDSLRPRGL